MVVIEPAKGGLPRPLARLLLARAWHDHCFLTYARTRAPTHTLNTVASWWNAMGTRGHTHERE